MNQHGRESGLVPHRRAEEGSSAASALPRRALLALPAALALALSLLARAEAPAAAPPTPPEKVRELKEGEKFELDETPRGFGLAMAILGAASAPQAGVLHQRVL